MTYFCVVIPVHGRIREAGECVSTVNLACVHNVELDGGHEGDGRQPVEARAKHTAEEWNESLEAVVQPRHVVGCMDNKQ